MAETNSTKEVVDDDKAVTEADLRDLKYSTDDVETSDEADEASEGEENEDDTEEAGEEEDNTDDSQEEDTDDSDETETDSSDFVKEFKNIKGDTPEEYARNLEEAYKNSTAEALRLKNLADAPKDSEVGTLDEVDISDPVSLYMKQKMNEDITAQFSDFSKRFPQVQDTSKYSDFTREVSTLSQTILSSQKRLASPKELYEKAAIILGWTPEDAPPTSKDKLNIALKDTAATSKTTSAGKKGAPKSKVTDQMLAANRLMYPGKTDAEIREELEPYI